MILAQKYKGEVSLKRVYYLYTDSDSQEAAKFNVNYSKSGSQGEGFWAMRKPLRYTPFSTPFLFTQYVNFGTAIIIYKY